MARRRRRSSGNGGVVGGVLAAVAIVAMIGGTAGFFYWSHLQYQSSEIDDISLCPDAGPVRHLAILVDTTDPISLTQVEAARQWIQDKIQQAEVHTRVSFATVSPTAETRGDLFFSMCKPQSGAEANFLNQNSRLVEERFQKEFAGPIDRAMSALLSVPEADSSPIMESLQEFAAKIPGFVVSNVPRDVVLMSDLVQHSDVFSFYRGNNWSKFEAEGGPARFGDSFNGASVSVLRVPRLISQSKVIDDFWVRYFDAQGFSNVHVKTLGDL